MKFYEGDCVYSSPDYPGGIVTERELGKKAIGFLGFVHAVQGDTVRVCEYPSGLLKDFHVGPEGALPVFKEKQR
jgi:hypothetical protein